MKKFTKNSSIKVIVLTEDGRPAPELFYPTNLNWELKEFDIIQAANEDDVIDIILDNTQVDAIVTYAEGKTSLVFDTLCNALSDEYKRRWFHFEEYDNFGWYLFTSVQGNELEHYSEPMFSITTPLYNTNPVYFKRALKSLQAQEYRDWEWVLVDDSPEPLNWVKTCIRAMRELRVKYYRVEPVSNGSIGTSKWRANCLSRGKWLLEFDHDDMLPPWALSEAVKGIEMYPDNGFIFSDDAPITGDDYFQGYTYGDEYGIGYAYPYESSAKDGDYTILSNRTPNINSATMRHIVGVPNHFRCWRRDVYFKIGGHNTLLRIADDYELLVRTFLETRMTHVCAPCYYQRFDGSNSQDAGNNRADIQRRVRWIANHYNKKIHAKALEYGFDEGDKYDPDDADVTMHNYYGNPYIPKYNDDYIPEWQTFKFRPVAKLPKDYVEPSNE